MTGDITGLLDRWGAGDRSALDQVAPLVYPQLRSIAGSFLRGERPGNTLNATGLVNELFVKLLGRKTAQFESRAHFYSLCARLMRMALIDHARSRRKWWNCVIWWAGAPKKPRRSKEYPSPPWIAKFAMPEPGFI